MDGPDSAKRRTVEFSEKRQSPEIMINGNIEFLVSFVCCEARAGGSNGVQAVESQAIDFRQAGVEECQERTFEARTGIQAEMGAKNRLNPTEGMEMGKVVPQAEGTPGIARCRHAMEDGRLGLGMGRIGIGPGCYRGVRSIGNDYRERHRVGGGSPGKSIAFFWNLPLEWDLNWGCRCDPKI